jgi:hypothetical protein
MKQFPSSLFIVSIFCFSACGQTFDNTVFEANRSQRADALAGKACDVYDQCNDFASGQTYQTRVDCVSDYKSKALTLWPSDKCGAGQMNDARFQVCVDKVQEQACTQNFWDVVGALGACNSNEVCSDPRLN